MRFFFCIILIKRKVDIHLFVLTCCDMFSKRTLLYIFLMYQVTSRKNEEGWRGNVRPRFDFCVIDYSTFFFFLLVLPTLPLTREKKRPRWHMDCCKTTLAIIGINNPTTSPSNCFTGNISSAKHNTTIDFHDVLHKNIVTQNPANCITKKNVKTFFIIFIPQTKIHSNKGEKS